MPPLFQNRPKRHADSDPEGEPPIKKFGLLQLAPTQSSTATKDTGKPSQDGQVSDSSMHLDDTKYTTYIYNIEQELADIEEREKHIAFIPEIEKTLNAIPKSILKEPKPENEIVLYGIPRSLTVTEDKDAVRKAIIESRARARAQNLESDKPSDPVLRESSALEPQSTNNLFASDDHMDIDSY